MLSTIPTALLALASVATAALVPRAEIQQRSFEYVIKPKVFIISLFRYDLRRGEASTFPRH